MADELRGDSSWKTASYLGAAMPSSASAQPASRRFVFGSPPDRVRMGPLSLFALVIIICLAVLSMLVFSTANASLTLSQRQADAVQATYANEQAAQEFVAALDEVLASARGGMGQGGASADAAMADEASSGRVSAGVTQLVADALDEMRASASAAGGGKMQVSAELDGSEVLATFASESGQALSIAITVSDNGTFRIDSWKTSAIHNEGEGTGRLLQL